MKIFTLLRREFLRTLPASASTRIIVPSERLFAGHDKLSALPERVDCSKSKLPRIILRVTFHAGLSYRDSEMLKKSGKMKVRWNTEASRYSGEEGR